MIHHDERGPVTLITLDRPERRNAVDLEALAALARAVETAAGRVIVLTGSAGHFCAGADLTGVEDEGFAVELHRVLSALRRVPVPVIAAVEGAALGAGTQLAIASDLRVAEPDARFGVPAARLGLMVDLWTVRRLTSIVGQGPAGAILLGADQLDGSRAHDLGLVQRLGPLDSALEWADELARLAPLTIAGHKLGLRAVEDDGVGSDDYERAFGAAWASRDLQEGIAAFRERRDPSFEGR
jgi:enoyl-CoA hydratase